MRKYILPKLKVYALESSARERDMLVCRIDDIKEVDPEFEVDELLIPRRVRDPLWSSREGFVGLGELLLAAYGESVVDVELNDVTAVALTDLVKDVDDFVEPYSGWVGRVGERDEVRRNLEEESVAVESEREELRSRIEEARRRVDG